MIAKNIHEINNRIAEKCNAANRNFNEITLVAVSKQNSVEAILEANNFGILNFGENKAKELKEKAEKISQKINWHFIGHLQTNKVKDVVQIAQLIHSVDSIKLAEEINKRAGNINKKQNILLEINTSGEESKFGLHLIEDIYKLAEFCKNAENLNLQGLMTMAPFTSDFGLVKNTFRGLRNIFEKLNAEGFALTDLSMGMTNDYEIAIEEGATILRIGTAIFSKR